MKKNIQKFILLFSACILFSCSERHSFTDKENLNLILNDLFLGDFYSCILKPEQKEKSGYQVNRNINLIYTKKIVGLIYRSDKWDHGNSIFVKNDKKQSEYYLGGFYADNDLKKSYKQIKNELKKYSAKLSKKKELVVLNKVDLIDYNEVKKIIKEFSKNTKSEVITLSTLEKKSVSQIKAKLISYAS